MPPVCSGNLWSVGHPGPAGLGGTQPPVLTIAPPTWGRGQGWPGLLSLRRSHREGNRCTVGPGLWSLEDAGSNSSSPFPPGELTWTSQRCSLFIHKRANAADTRGVSNRKENAPCLVHSPVLGAWQEFIHIGPPPHILCPQGPSGGNGLSSSHSSPCSTASSTRFSNKLTALRSTIMETGFPKACRKAARAMAPGGPSVSSGGWWLKCVGKPVVTSTARAWDSDKEARSSSSLQSRCPIPRWPKIIIF